MNENQANHDQRQDNDPIDGHEIDAPKRRNSIREAKFDKTDSAKKLSRNKGVNNLWKAVLKIRTPIQLVALFLALVSVYWISKIGLSSVQGVVILLLFVVLILAAGFLFYLEKIKEDHRTAVIIIIFVGILGILFYLISLFFVKPSFETQTDRQGIYNFRLYLREINKANFKDFNRIQIVEESLGSFGLKDTVDSYIQYQVLGNPAAKHLKFRIKTARYVFFNKTYQLEFSTKRGDTDIVLKDTNITSKSQNLNKTAKNHITVDSNLPRWINRLLSNRLNKIIKYPKLNRLRLRFIYPKDGYYEDLKDGIVKYGAHGKVIVYVGEANFSIDGFEINEKKGSKAEVDQELTDEVDSIAKSNIGQIAVKIKGLIE